MAPAALPGADPLLTVGAHSGSCIASAASPETRGATITSQPRPALPPSTNGRHDRRRPARRTAAWIRGVALAAAATTGTVAFVPTSEAAATFTRTELSAQVQGNAVTAKITVTAGSRAVAERFKICARDRNETNLDYRGQDDVVLTSRGSTYVGTKPFPVGTYTYWACIKVWGHWRDVGAKKTFTVSPAALATTMPTRSTKPGWAYSYGQDFTRPAARGQFSKVYGSSWAGYTGIRNDTSRNGSYRPDKVLSVADGVLDMSLGHDAATGLYNVAAPFPQPPAGVNGGSIDYLGMRSTIRFKSTKAMPGYKVAWMLWPKSWNWKDGEIDFPEASLDNQIWGFSHQADNGRPHLNAMWTRSASTMHEGGWHTATTEWVPGKSVEFFLDGASVGRTTDHVPTKPMHWTLQTETELSTKPPAKSTRGHILVDWLTVEAYKG